MDNMQEYQIEVYNLKGEQQEIQYSANTPDLSALPSGQYTIRICQGDFQYTGGFIKE